MAAPDFARARRQLRRARVEDALQMNRNVNVALNRDRLLERLAPASDLGFENSFDELDEVTVDLVVSMALAEVEEADVDALSVVLMCVRVLSVDGQFARVEQLGPRLASLGERFQVERPYLADTVMALAQVLKGQRDAPHRHLDAMLGLTDTVQPLRLPRSRELINDIIAATALRSWLADNDLVFVEKARQIAVDRGDGLLLLLIDVILAFASAASAADLVKVVTACDPTFSEPALQTYLTRRRIRTLFPSQISAIQAGATSDSNLVVALPTSSGKTFIAELRIAAALSRHPGSRALYIAPYRLLSRQVERSLSEGLSPLGLVVKDLGSGYDPSFEYAVESASQDQSTIDAPPGPPDVVICTPERLDALLRLSTATVGGSDGARQLLDSVKVIVFDELQLVGRQGRGPRFELLLTRIRWRYPDVQFLGLSAASYGTGDVAAWITGNAPVTGGRRPTGTLELLWEADGRIVQRAGNTASLVGELPRRQAIIDASELALRFSSNYQPVLVIETTRPLTEGFAQRVAEMTPAAGTAWRDSLTDTARHEIDVVVQEVKVLLGEDHPLADLLRVGIAYHHAGVPSHLLRHIEALASKRLLRILAATTTVAEGADLPFRVVIIPHLNFASRTGRLERDLYLNIVGRAGRANVAMEGIVVTLNSSARTLSNLVRSSLWTDVTSDRIRGRLADVSADADTIEDRNTYQDLQSQVLAWLSEGGSEVDDQARRLAERTLSWREHVGADRRVIVRTIDSALRDLERRGLALAASPYKATPLGRRVSLGGLSAPSAIRLNRALDRQRDGWLAELPGLHSISYRQAISLAALLFETTEVLEHGLWLKRNSSRRNEDLDVLTQLCDGQMRWPYDHDLYSTDIELLALWISGSSYSEIADAAPVFPRVQSLFGGTEASKRSSDSAEYVGRLAYPAGWTWSAARVLLGDLGENLPAFLRHAVEQGAPNETACVLLSRAGVTRPAALKISQLFGSDWSLCVPQLLDFELQDAVAHGITESDRERLTRFSTRLRLSWMQELGP
jgi:replicative superfamily II helicase